jgi:hypothetical protein
MDYLAFSGYAPSPEVSRFDELARSIMLLKESSEGRIVMLATSNPVCHIKPQNQLTLPPQLVT